MQGLLSHSAKGTEWKNHKYLKKEDGRYYYPEDTRASRRSPDRKNLKKNVPISKYSSDGGSGNSIFKSGLRYQMEQKQKERRTEKLQSIKGSSERNLKARLSRSNVDKQVRDVLEKNKDVPVKNISDEYLKEVEFNSKQNKY